MGKHCKINIKEFVELQKKVKQLSKNDIDIFIQESTKELASRLLAKTIKRTPVGQYNDHVGGTLRKGWTIGEITKTTTGYEIEIINPVVYSMYVEYGHRTPDHKGWVEGRFMLTISEEEIKNSAPAILEAKLNKMLKDVFQ